MSIVTTGLKVSGGVNSYHWSEGLGSVNSYHWSEGLWVSIVTIGLRVSGCQ